MPLFDYKCLECFWTDELLRQGDEEAGEECPRCGGRFIRQPSWSVSKPVFNGSGYYETDFKNKS